MTSWDPPPGPPTGPGPSTWSAPPPPSAPQWGPTGPPPVRRPSTRGRRPAPGPPAWGGPNAGWSPARPLRPRPRRGKGRVVAILVGLVLVGVLAVGAVACLNGQRRTGLPRRLGSPGRRPGRFRGRHPGHGVRAPGGGGVPLRSPTSSNGSRRTPSPPTRSRRSSRPSPRPCGAGSRRGRARPLPGQHGPHRGGHGRLLQLRHEVVGRAGRGLTPYVQSVLVHELTHALQDQHFDIRGSDDDTSGEDTGLTSLVESDAVLGPDAVGGPAPRVIHRDRFDAEQAATIEDADLGGLPAKSWCTASPSPTSSDRRSTPDLLVDDGLDAVDAAFDDPPSRRSAGPVPHAVRHRDDPLPVDTPAVGDGETVIDSGDWGAFGLLRCCRAGSTTSRRWRPSRAGVATPTPSVRTTTATCACTWPRGDTPVDLDEIEQAFDDWPRASHGLG